jgi:stage V sporulation protein D (sporulation-specific penicillin-binding protein)
VVSDAYEPGSTFKIVTLSSSLDSGNAVHSVYCPGYRIVAGTRVKCWRSGGHGQQDLQKVVQNSCNPGFMDMALRMGVDTFYDYIYAFGLGSTTGSGLPGESGGIVTHEKYIREPDLARIGFGQSIAVTPIQLITAASAAVNGGNLMQPYVVSRIVSRSGEVILENKPAMVRSVIKPETSQMVRELLEGVVTGGSGRNAAIPGYRVGGKTGTAQKYVDGKPSSSALIASFIGFAPADDPEYICLIIVDEPKVGVVFGSTVAAPFFKQVMEQTLRHYRVKSDEAAETVTVPDVTGAAVSEAKNKLYAAGLKAVYQAEDNVIAQIPKAGDRVLAGTEILLYTELTAPDPENWDDAVMITVPDVSGMTRLEANDRLKEEGLVIVFDPPDRYGTAISQTPKAGEKVPAGSQVKVEFSDTGAGSDRTP